MVIRNQIREGSGNSGMKLQAYAILTPIDRLLDAAAWNRIIAIAGATVGYLITDVFTSALALIVLSGACDYFLGVQTAKRRNAYDAGIAHAGAIGKVSGVMIMLLVRMAEHWMMSQGVGNTRGWIAAAL